jgi:hypothetical protein
MVGKLSLYRLQKKHQVVNSSLNLVGSNFIATLLSFSVLCLLTIWEKDFSGQLNVLFTEYLKAVEKLEMPTIGSMNRRLLDLHDDGIDKLNFKSLRSTENNRDSSSSNFIVYSYSYYALSCEQEERDMQLRQMKQGRILNAQNKT